jgi:hypothetical protein
MKGSYAKLKSAMDIVNKWQADVYVHPLTCGNNSIHGDLYPRIYPLSYIENSFELKLCCKECDWKQDIPIFFKDILAAEGCKSE